MCYHFEDRSLVWHETRYCERSLNSLVLLYFQNVYRQTLPENAVHVLVARVSYSLLRSSIGVPPNKYPLEVTPANVTIFAICKVLS